MLSNKESEQLYDFRAHLLYLYKYNNQEGSSELGLATYLTHTQTQARWGNELGSRTTQEAESYCCPKYVLSEF